MFIDKDKRAKQGLPRVEFRNVADLRLDALHTFTMFEDEMKSK